MIVNFIYLLTSADVMWAQNFDNSEKYLMAIHPPYSFVIWDVTTGVKLWKKTYAEQILAIDFDPFDPTRLACKFSKLIAIKLIKNMLNSANLFYSFMS